MENLIKFINLHLEDDTTRLILDRKKWPEINMDIAVNTIESRRKLKGKVAIWAGHEGLIFPLKLSAEQCSSDDTGRYKADLAARINLCDGQSPNKPLRIADLTGGLGVDSWYFSKIAEEVLYCEMQETLVNAAIHNYEKLGCRNICIKNHMVVSAADKTANNAVDKATNNAADKAACIKDIIGNFAPAIIYMDPARRSKDGRKVFLIEDCSPDVLKLKDEIFEICRHFLIKLSPMADITAVADRLGTQCREIHIISSGGECKEVLVWMDRQWENAYTITINENGNSLSYSPSEAKEAQAQYATEDLLAKKGLILFEPGKALLKSGGFNFISSHFKIAKLDRSTHLYLSDNQDISDIIRKFGKTFRIIEILPFNNSNIKYLGRHYPQAEVTARNIPLTSENLMKKIGCRSGGELHIFGLSSLSSGKILIIGERLKMA